MNAPVKHHHNPQHLLRGFTDSAGKLHFYDSKHPRKGVQYDTPREFFYERDYYSWIDLHTGNKDPALELFYAQKVENQAAPVIAKIVQAARSGTLPNLSAKEKEAWSRFWYFQFKRTPDAMDPLIASYEARLLDGKIEDERGERDLTPAEQAIVLTLADRMNILQNARVGAQSSDPPPGLMAKMTAERGMLIAHLPRKALIIGSRPIVSFLAPGFSNPADGGTELWLPVASDVAISPGGPPSSEMLVPVTDAKAIKEFNLLMARQSSQIAGRSKGLVKSFRGACLSGAS